MTFAISNKLSFFCPLQIESYTLNHHLNNLIVIIKKINMENQFWNILQTNLPVDIPKNVKFILK